MEVEFSLEELLQVLQLKVVVLLEEGNDPLFGGGGRAQLVKLRQDRLYVLQYTPQDAMVAASRRL